MIKFLLTHPIAVLMSFWVVNTITGEMLKEGDEIIFSGNINLVHELSVKIK